MSESNTTFTYKTIYSKTSPEDLDIQVNQLINAGYQLSGSPYMVMYPYGSGTYIPYWVQAIIKVDPA